MTGDAGSTVMAGMTHGSVTRQVPVPAVRLIAAGACGRPAPLPPSSRRQVCPSVYLGLLVCHEAAIKPEITPASLAKVTCRWVTDTQPSTNHLAKYTPRHSAR